MKVPKVYKPWYDLARSLGWEITMTGSGHLKWQPPPPGRAVFSPATPGDNHGGHLRVKAKLKRAGLPV
jgi:hypothetical protein